MADSPFSCLLLGRAVRGRRVDGRRPAVSSKPRTALARKSTIEGEAMYASVRKYDVPPDRSEEFMRRVDAEFTPQLEQMPGFVAYQLIDGGLDRSQEARVFAITVCHDRASAERSAELAARFVEEDLADLGIEPLEAATGAVRVSRAVTEVLQAAHV